VKREKEKEGEEERRCTSILPRCKMWIFGWMLSKQHSVAVRPFHSPQTESSESVSVNSESSDVPPAARRTSYTTPTVSHPSTQCSAASSSRALIHHQQPHSNVTVNISPGIHSSSLFCGDISNVRLCSTISLVINIQFQLCGRLSSCKSTPILCCSE